MCVEAIFIYSNVFVESLKMAKAGSHSTYLWKGNTDLALTKWPTHAAIKQIALGLHHSALLNCHDQVLCCGQNSHGQLGIGSNSGSHMEPLVVPCLEGVL